MKSKGSDRLNRCAGRSEFLLFLDRRVRDIFSDFLTEIYIVTCHENYLSMMVVLMGCNIFNIQLWKIICKIADLEYCIFLEDPFLRVKSRKIFSWFSEKM